METTNNQQSARTKEITLKAGEKNTRLGVMAELMGGLSDLFEVVRDKDTDTARQMFGTDQVSQVKKNFKVKLIVEIDESQKE